jgi:hypothetical protein
MRRALLGLGLMLGATAHSSSSDLVRSYLSAFINTPKNRALGSVVVGGGGALVLGISGFPVAALAAVVCGGVGFTYHCVQGVTPNLQAARQYLDQARHDQAETRLVVDQNSAKISEIYTNLQGIDGRLSAITADIASQKNTIDALNAQAKLNHAKHIANIQARIAQVKLMQDENTAQVKIDQKLRERFEGQQKTVEDLIAAGNKLSEEQKQQLEEMQLVNNQIERLMQSVQARARRRSNSGDSNTSSASMSSSGTGSVGSSLRLVRGARDGVSSISSAQMSLWSVGIRATPLNSPGFADAGGASPRVVLQRAAEQAQGKLPKSSRH